MKDVAAQTNAIAECLKTLEQSSKMLHGLTEQANPLAEELLDISQFNLGVAKVLTHIFELEADLYDLEPDYTPEHLRPSLAPINLGAVLDYLSAKNSAVQHSAQRQLAGHMTDAIAAEFTEACSQGQGLAFAQKWWESQNKPYIPVVQTYRNLYHARKSMRYHSAALLEDIFNITLWDDDAQEVLLANAQDWFTQWLQMHT